MIAQHGDRRVVILRFEVHPSGQRERPRALRVLGKFFGKGREKRERPLVAGPGGVGRGVIPDRKQGRVRGVKQRVGAARATAGGDLLIFRGGIRVLLLSHESGSLRGAVFRSTSPGAST